MNLSEETHFLHHSKKSLSGEYKDIDSHLLQWIQKNWVKYVTSVTNNSTECCTAVLLLSRCKDEDYREDYELHPV